MSDEKMNIRGTISHIEKRLDAHDSAFESLAQRLERVAERLEYHIERHIPQEANTPQEEANDTHRTVTLRIPKGMRVGEAIYEAWAINIGGDAEWLRQFVKYAPDTDLQKALDEVEHE